MKHRRGVNKSTRAMRHNVEVIAGASSEVTPKMVHLALDDAAWEAAEIGIPLEPAQKPVPSENPIAPLGSSEIKDSKDQIVTLEDKTMKEETNIAPESITKTLVLTIRGRGSRFHSIRTRDALYYQMRRNVKDAELEGVEVKVEVSNELDRQVFVEVRGTAEALERNRLKIEGFTEGFSSLDNSSGGASWVSGNRSNAVEYLSQTRGIRPSYGSPVIDDATSRRLIGTLNQPAITQPNLTQLQPSLQNVPTAAASAPTAQTLQITPKSEGLDRDVYDAMVEYLQFEVINSDMARDSLTERLGQSEGQKKSAEEKNGCLETRLVELSNRLVVSGSKNESPKRGYGLLKETIDKIQLGRVPEVKDAGRQYEVVLSETGIDPDADVETQIADRAVKDMIPFEKMGGYEERKKKYDAARKALRAAESGDEFINVNAAKGRVEEFERGKKQHDEEQTRNRGAKAKEIKDKLKLKLSDRRIVYFLQTETDGENYKISVVLPIEHREDSREFSGLDKDLIAHMQDNMSTLVSDFPVEFRRENRAGLVEYVFNIPRGSIKTAEELKRIEDKIADSIKNTQKNTSFGIFGLEVDVTHIRDTSNYPLEAKIGAPQAEVRTDSRVQAAAPVANKITREAPSRSVGSVENDLVAKYDGRAVLEQIKGSNPELYRALIGRGTSEDSLEGKLRVASYYVLREIGVVDVKKLKTIISDLMPGVNLSQKSANDAHGHALSFLIRNGAVRVSDDKNKFNRVFQFADNSTRPGVAMETPIPRVIQNTPEMHYVGNDGRAVEEIRKVAPRAAENVMEHYTDAGTGRLRAAIVYAVTKYGPLKPGQMRKKIMRDFPEITFADANAMSYQTRLIKYLVRDGIFEVAEANKPKSTSYKLKGDSRR